MGKSQYKNKTRRRYNPIRVPENHGPKGEQGKEEDVLPIIKKLSSADPSDRSWSLSAISNLSSTPHLRRLFLSSGIISHLIDRFTDSVENVVVEATGAMRNLLVDAGSEVGGEVVNNGGLVALGGLVPKISTTIQKFLSSPTPTSDAEVTTYRLIFPLAENVLSIFWSLCETSNKTLQALNTMDLIPFLVAFLENMDNLPRGVVVAAAQCLYALSSDNPPIQTILSSNPSISTTLLSILSSSHPSAVSAPKPTKETADMEIDTEKSIKDALRRAGDEERLVLIKVLIAGVLRSMKTEVAGEDMASGIEQLVGEQLDVDLEGVVREVEGCVEEEEAEVKTEQPLSDHRSIPSLKLESIERRLATVMVALEIMTALCASSSDDEYEDLGTGSEEDDEMVDEDEEVLIAQGREPGLVEMEINARQGVVDENDGARCARLAALAMKTTKLSFPPFGGAEGTTEVKAIHPPTTALLSAIHLRALESLNNLLLSFAESAPPPVAPTNIGISSEQSAWNGVVANRLGGLQDVWDGSFGFARVTVPNKEVTMVKGQEIRLECLEMLCGVWWGIARVGGSGVLTVSHDQLQVIMDAYTVIQEDEAKARLINTLGALAMRPSVTIEENQVIGAFLLSIIQSLGSATPASAETAVASLNAIFDVYADETSTYDSVFRQGGFLKILVGSVPKIKGMCKSVDRRKLPELRMVADEAYENLVAFIKYRRSVA